MIRSEYSLSEVLLFWIFLHGTNKITNGTRTKAPGKHGTNKNIVLSHHYNLSISLFFFCYMNIFLFLLGISKTFFLLMSKAVLTNSLLQPDLISYLYMEMAPYQLANNTPLTLSPITKRITFKSITRFDLDLIKKSYQTYIKRLFTGSIKS